MPLNPSQLKDDLAKVFKDMEDGSKDNQFFADGVADAYKAFAEAGMAATVDAGAIAAGAYAGAGQGSPKLDASIMSAMVKAACDGMDAAPAVGTDVALLAPAIAGGYTAMMAAPMNLETTVTGVATPPPPAPPVPMGGQAKGQSVVVPAAHLAMLTACFTSMYGANMGNDYMAAQCSAGGAACTATAVVNTVGQGPLAGSVGVGAIT